MENDQDNADTPTQPATQQQVPEDPSLEQAGAAEEQSAAISHEPASEETGSNQPDLEPPRVKPGQIPLLDDVVFNTELPFPRSAAKTRKAKPERAVDENAPRPTDLFGGSPETAQSGPLSADYAAKDMDELRNSTEEMVDNLVAEYSQQIVSRLRQELTSLLEELDEPKPDPEKEP